MNIADEEIIMQGDEANLMYILLTGKVKVYLNQSIADDSASKRNSVLNVKRRFQELKKV